MRSSDIGRSLELQHWDCHSWKNHYK